MNKIANYYAYKSARLRNLCVVVLENRQLLGMLLLTGQISNRIGQRRRKICTMPIQTSVNTPRNAYSYESGRVYATEWVKCPDK